MKGVKYFALLLLGGIIGVGLGVTMMWQGQSTHAVSAAGHEHVLVAHDGVEATCEAAGTRSYWECPECQLYFVDADGFTAIAAEDLDDWVVIPQVSHKTNAKRYHAYVNSTCAVEGHRDYYDCAYGCGTMFADAECRYEVTWDDLVIEKRRHAAALEHKAYQAADCEHDGWVAHDVCVNCGQTFVDGQAVPAADVFIAGGHHVDQYVEQVDPTCTETGCRAYYTCSGCDKIFADIECTNEYVNGAEIIARAAHQPTTHHAEEPVVDCEHDGVPEYWICETCGQYFSDEDCRYLLTDADYAAYQAAGKHDWQMVYLPDCRIDQDAVPHRYLRNGQVVADKLQYYQTCSICEKHDGKRSVPCFATYAADASVEYVTIEGSDEIDYDLFTIDAATLTPNEDGSYDVKISIKLPVNYSTASKIKRNGEFVTITVEHSGADEIITLNVHFDQAPTSLTDVWEFDWDGDVDNYEQTIKIVINA